MMPAFVLLPSPLLGPSVWSPVAAALRSGGVDVLEVPAMPSAPSSPSQVLSHLLDVVPAAGSFVLVPHSNAGLLVPQLTMARPVVGFVFVDSLLPPSVGETPVVEPSRLPSLAALADDGVLPRWTRWWSGEAVDGLFPNDETRKRVDSEAPRLPLSYFQSSVAVPAGWDDRPGAYLAFGDTYDDARRAAVERGWPTATMDGTHLHQLHEPGAVADELQRLAGPITPRQAR